MRKLSELTLDELVGQLIMVGFHETELTDELAKKLIDNKIGNIILFTRNIKDINQLLKLNQDIHKLYKEKLGITPFIAIDQEGGMVARIFTGATLLPGAMSLSSASFDKQCYQAGNISGEELINLGINVNFAPDMDVQTNPKNPVIGVRSFGKSSKLVADCAIAYGKGLESHGVIPVGKHFPGHGDTAVDSHYGLPVVDHDIKRLEEVELYPFKQAISENFPALMTTHILFKTFESENVPGTLSRKILTDLLRTKLQFKGLVFTDCMEMDAIKKFYGTVNGSVQAVKAGADVICISHTYEYQVEAINSIKEKIANGEISLEEVKTTVARILEFKEKNEDKIEKFLNSTNDELLSKIATKENLEFASSVVDDSLTHVCGKTYNKDLKTLVVALNPVALNAADDEYDERSIISSIEHEHINVDKLLVTQRPSTDELNKIKEIMNNYEQVLCCTYNANIFTQQIELIKLINSHENGIILSMRNPYDNLLVPDIKNYYCLYEYTTNSVKTVLKLLKGEITPKGTLQV